ncbi:peptidoglycan-binding domain-containing protein [Streptomyces cinereoruber]|uniref:peptidoglycan-binding domain-containing protein n=1 Tax=Streptomyces cinereoruber TaxID=67260 RepID=UPI003C2DF3E4
MSNLRGFAISSTVPSRLEHLMRDRTASTTAVTSGTREPVSPPARGNRVFGKVAKPSGDGPGAREEDVELFDSALILPRVPKGDGPHGRRETGRPRARKASRSQRTVRAVCEHQVGMSLSLLVLGALAAGIGLTVGLTSGLHRTPPDHTGLTVPGFPPSETVPETEPPATPSSDVKPSATGQAVVRTTAPMAPTTSPPPSGRPSRTPTPTPATTLTRKPEPSSSPGPSLSEQPDEDHLRLGSSGPEVADLQRRLRRLSLFSGRIDGRFGEAVETALIRYQETRRIPERRGVYGSLTRAALHAETDRDDRDDRDNRDDRGDWSDRDD